MPTIELVSDDHDVREGAKRAGVELGIQADAIDRYDGIIYFKRTPIHKREGVTVVKLDNLVLLSRFVNETVQELYRLNIIR